MLKDSFGAPWVKVPLAAVSSRAFIQWQCGSDSGMTLNRLAEVCGCFANEQETYGCHHPETAGQCLAQECPIAYIDYPEGASEEACDRYAEGYGDEIDMCLATEAHKDKGQHFGQGGTPQTHWCREYRRADEFVEAQLPNPRQRQIAEPAINDEAIDQPQRESAGSDKVCETCRLGEESNCPGTLC